MTQDRYEKIGTPQGDVSDTLTATPIGVKGAPVAPPHSPGQGGDAPPLEPVRLTHYPIAGGVPAP